jgi:carbon monoxide dehydrogenase subunit G
MDMKGERLLPSDRATAWRLLNDSEVLKQCVPGCESMTASGESSYDVVMNSAIGPVKARFKGKLSLTDIEAPTRYRLLFDGQSSQAGFARGEAKVELQEVSPRETRLVYSATAQIGGKLAQMGARLIDAAAAATADKFFECFAAQLAARSTPVSTATAEGAGAAAEQAEPKPAAPAHFGFWSWLRSFFRHLFAH